MARILLYNVSVNRCPAWTLSDQLLWNLTNRDTVNTELKKNNTNKKRKTLSWSAFNTGTFPLDCFSCYYRVRHCACVYNVLLQKTDIVHAFTVCYCKKQTLCMCLQCVTAKNRHCACVYSVLLQKTDIVHVFTMCYCKNRHCACVYNVLLQKKNKQTLSMCFQCVNALTAW